MAQWKKQSKAASVLAGCGMVILAGCTTRPAQTPDEQIRQQAAQGAQQMRHDLRNAGKQTRQALREAGRETRAAVAGAREGWRAGAPVPAVGTIVDVNHASAQKLETLPGVHASTARKIVAGRPYVRASELQKRGILSRDQYEKIAGRISAE